MQYLTSLYRKTVRDILNNLLPGELETRKRNKLIRRTYRTNGPNHVIHVDQYDKLASFGFYIHGAMDGFSRKIAWLYVGNSNRNSSIVLRFYLSYIQSIKGIPKILRTDGGTENSLMLKVHTVLHEHIGNRHPCCIVGRSVHNQRIERFWGYLRQHFTQRWIDLFHELLRENLYNPNDQINYELLQFCFTGILSKEIIDISEGWNYHRVRSTKGSICPAGIPEVLFFVPELNDGHDYESAVDDDLINFTDNTLGASQRKYGCTNEFAELCLEIMDIKNWDIPQSVDDALYLYCNLFLIFKYPDTM